jgi:thiol-disulfide isomerase/thioredoxin
MKLNSSLLISIPVLLFFSCKPKQEKGETTIHGTLRNAVSSMVYLEKIGDTGELVIDSVMTDASGNFSLHAKVSEKDYYMVRTDPSNLIFLLLKGDENIEITGDAKNIESTYMVKGSDDSELIRLLKTYDRNLSDSLNLVYSTFRENSPEKKDSLGGVLQKYYSQRMELFARNFVTTNPKSIVSLSATKYLNQQTDLQLYEDLLASLNKEYSGNKYVKDYASIVENLKKLPVGSAAPEIKLNSPEGKAISLSSLKGKIVLIDFWASWCGPCRKENPRNVELYRKFKSKNLEIFGVSLDDNAEAWKEAIKRDHLSWPQVSELKKWDSEVVKTYLIDAIPFTVLIDREGKIIAKGLSGDELEQKVIEAL